MVPWNFIINKKGSPLLVFGQQLGLLSDTISAGKVQKRKCTLKIKSKRILKIEQLYSGFNYQFQQQT